MAQNTVRTCSFWLTSTKASYCVGTGLLQLSVTVELSVVISSGALSAEGAGAGAIVGAVAGAIAGAGAGAMLGPLA